MAKAGTMLRRGAAEARAQKAGMEASMAVRDSAKAAAHAAAGLAQSLRDEVREGRVAERAGDLAGRAREESRARGEQAMLRLGDWVMTPQVADKLGLKARTRRVGLLGVVLGMAAGVVAGMLLARRAQPAAGGASWDEPESLAPPLGRGQVDPAQAADAQADAAGDPHRSVTA